MKQFVVIDYGAGNLRSVVRALSHVGANLLVTSDPNVVCKAEAVVLPGVGATLDTMQSLQSLGMVDAIHELVGAGLPFLGICVGMQVLCSTSEEFSQHSCLGVVEGHVRRLPAGQKVPQIGWNQLCYSANHAQHALFTNIPDRSDVYFVHSYYCDLKDPTSVAGQTNYGLDFPSVLIHNNLAAVQFHPEKSGQIGLQLLANFVAWASTWK